MRMDRDSEELPVSRLVNRAKLEEDLKDIIERYGEDPQAGRIARAIVEARVRKPIETTRGTGGFLWSAPIRRHGGPRPGTTPPRARFRRCAWRSTTEIGELERFLDAIPRPVLKPGGRVAVISLPFLGGIGW